MYIRLTGGSNIPLIFNEDYNFSLGKSSTLKEGKDIAILSTGTMLNVAMETANLIKKSNLSAEVINIHTIKPIDANKIIECGKKFNYIATIEEHNIIGGLGSAVAECLTSSGGTAKQLFYGINDKYSDGGEYKYLLKKFKLTAEDISKSINDTIK